MKLTSTATETRATTTTAMRWQSKIIKFWSYFGLVIWNFLCMISKTTTLGVATTTTNASSNVNAAFAGAALLLLNLLLRFIASAAAPSSFFCVFTSLSALTRTANSLTIHTHAHTNTTIQHCQQPPPPKCWARFSNKNFTHTYTHANDEPSSSTCRFFIHIHKCIIFTLNLFELLLLS